MFPAVRVQGPSVEPFLERIAGELPDEDDIPEALLESGLAQIDREEWQRTVESWTLPYADRWQSLVTAAGDVERAEQALLVGALRVGIAERQPTPHDRFALLEDGRLSSPHLALAVVLPPQLVWSIDEANAASVARHGRRRPRARMDAVERVAFALMTFEHIVRTRAVCRRLARELPVAAFPTASNVLAGATRGVEQDIDLARSAAAALLVAHVEELHHFHNVT
jgi:hypothetical protein